MKNDISLRIKDAIRSAETPSALVDALNQIDGISENFDRDLHAYADFALAIASHFLYYADSAEYIAEFGGVAPDDIEGFSVLGWCNKDAKITEWRVEGGSTNALTVSFESLKTLTPEDFFPPSCAENFNDFFDATEAAEMSNSVSSNCDLARSARP